MNCQFCRSQLPKEAHACPACGNLTPTHNAEADNATVPSAKLQYTNIAHDPPPPDPYNPSSPLGNASPEMQNPYSSPLNPYNPISTSLLPSQLSSTVKRKKSVPVKRAILLLAILLGIGAIIWPRWLHNRPITLTPLVANPSPTIVTPAPPPQAQSLYSQITHGTPILNDALAGPDNYGWDNYAEANTSCSFSSNAYYAKAGSSYFSPCYAKATNYSDFIFQVEATIVSGHSAGIVFRADSTNDKAYRFRISTDGTYILNKFFFDSGGQPHQTILTSGQSSLIVTGTNQPNVVSAIAQGTSIYLFVNNKYVDHVSDSTYQSGQVGVYADSDANEVDAMFRNARVWKL